MAFFDIPPELVPLLRAEWKSKIDKQKAMQAPELPVDWDEILKRMNAWYDRMLDAADEPTFAQSMKAFDQISLDQQEMQKGTDFIELLVAEEATNATQKLGNLLIGTSEKLVPLQTIIQK